MLLTYVMRSERIFIVTNLLTVKVSGDIEPLVLPNCELKY